MRYLPLSDTDRSEMLRVIGASSIDDLFRDVPEDERAEIAAAVADRVGSNIADYVRLRFIMRKPA